MVREREEGGVAEQAARVVILSRQQLLMVYHVIRPRDAWATGNAHGEACWSS